MKKKTPVDPVAIAMSRGEMVNGQPLNFTQSAHAAHLASIDYENEMRARRQQAIRRDLGKKYQKGNSS